MKAVTVAEFGPPESLRWAEMPAPQPGPGQVAIRVRAAGLNFADTLMVAGKYQVKPDLPFVPGMEAAGEVIACGAGVTRFRPGDRVMAVCDSGAFAEQAVAHESAVYAIPEAMDFATAATFPIVYGTAHLALGARGRLKPGETLLVHGAAGGVGLAAVEIGKRMGATVIATAGSAEKLALARAHGADHVIDYTAGPFIDAVKDIGLADAVFDPVGGDVFDQSLRCVNWEARILVIGFAAGRIPQAPANILLVKNVDVVGVFWGAYRRRAPQQVRDGIEELLGWWREGALKPHVSMTFPAQRTAEAMAALLGRATTGKVAIALEG
ncbi:MAG: NADPH:quinone oxidoreductase family protein [Alphaproteobacteria bacterium]